MAIVSLMTPEIRKLRLGTYRPRQHSGMLTQQLYNHPCPESTFSCKWHDGWSGQATLACLVAFGLLPLGLPPFIFQCEASTKVPLGFLPRRAHFRHS